MSLSRKKCCVPGCMDSKSMRMPLHLFPNPAKDKHRFNTWVLSIGADIIGLDNDDIYKHRSVCHAHFEEKYCCRFNKLSNIAVPTLNLPGAYMHRFPHPEKRAELFAAWMSIIGDKLQGVDPLRIYKNKKICDYHFLSEHKVASHRLLNSAVPTLHLSGLKRSDGISVELEHNYSLPRMSSLNPRPNENVQMTENQFIDKGSKPSAKKGLNKNVDDSLDKTTEEYLMPGDTQNTVEQFEEKKVCRICLRERTFNEELDDALAEYYDELVYFDTYEHGALRVCLFCEHQLRRSYNFRQESRRAHILLKAWSADEHKKPIHELYKMLPQPALGCGSNAKSNQKVYNITFSSDNEKDENINVLNDSNNCTLDLKSYVQDFLRTSEPKNVQFESEIVQHESEMVQLEPGNVHYEPENVKIGPVDEFGNRDAEANVEMNDASFDTHKGVENKEKKKKIKRHYVKKVKINLLLLSPEERAKHIQQKKMKSKSTRNIKRAAFLKDGIVRLMDSGELHGIEDVGVTLDKELFLKIFDKCSFSSMLHWGVLAGRGLPKIPKLRSFLLFLLKRYNPQYDTIFEVECLNTQEQKVAEFQSRQYTKDYLEAHHKCDVCYKVFEVQGLLDFHKNWHDPNSPNVCSICAMRFKSQIATKKHHYLNHQFVFRCKLCPLFTNSPNRMRSHYNDHMGAEYQCSICKKKFRSKSTMENHKRVHTTASLCPLCAKNLQSPHGLQMHLKLKHSNESPELLASSPSVQCNQCAAAFYAEDTLSRHISMIHKAPKPSKALFCFFCKEEFDTLSALHRHRIKSEHRGKRRRPSPPDGASRTCPLCKEAVPSINSLALYWHYKKVHPSEPYEVQPAARNYLCEHCGKGFKARPVYEDHLNTHTGERPYECIECGARFACRLTAKIHVEGHGPPNHRCDRCPKRFKTASALCRHARNHTGERNYVCFICTKTFSHSDGLKLHVDSVHQNIRKIRNRRKQSDQMKDEATIPDQMRDEAITQDQMIDEAKIEGETKVTYVLRRSMFQNEMEDVTEDQMKNETRNQMKDAAMFDDQMKDDSASQDQFYVEYMTGEEGELYSQGVCNEEIVNTVDYDSDDSDEF